MITSAFLLFGCLSISAQTRQAASTTLIFNPDGWRIPALQDSHLKPGTTPHAPAGWGNAEYEATLLRPREGHDLSKVPRVYLDSEANRLVYEEQTVKVLEIRRYEVNARPYCYKVTVMVKSENPKSDEAGWAGEIDLYYYDEAGKGTWTLMDTTGPLLPEIPKPVWERK